jgi:DNA-binding NarL/FixJ family response regulator
MITVSVVDNEKIFRDGFRSWAVLNASGLDVVVCVPSVADLLGALDGPPQVTVLDVMLENRTRLADNVRRLAEWGTDVVVATIDPGAPGMLRAAFTAGARAFVHKGTFEEVRDAVVHCATHRQGLFPNQLLWRYTRIKDQEWPVLTDRQVEVLDLKAAGLSTKAIQQHLRIGRKAVEGHLQAILRRAARPDRPLETPEQFKRFRHEYGYSDEW